MIHSLLANAADQSNASWHDRIQIALAIADEGLLKSLLLDCTPPIAQSHRLGGMHSRIGVPAVHMTADGVLEFEEISCVLAEPEQLEQSVLQYSRRHGNQRGYLDLIRCETETQTLGQAISLSHAISLLAHGGFAANQVKAILNLPYDAWHKSWWYSIDEAGQFTVPFLRLLRSRHFADGTLTLQYKDFFAQEQPACFKSRNQKVLVQIMTDDHQFPVALARINQLRQTLQSDKALLICNQISDLEARGFISQGISLYAASEIVLPVKANCLACITPCPLQGKPDSPVLLCQQFCLNAE
jgi:hypothetical protein